LLATERVPDVASISAAAGVPLILGVLTVAGFPSFVGVPGVVGFHAVAFIPALAGVSAVAVVPAVADVPSVAVVPVVDGVFAVASFSWYLYVLYYTMYRPSDYRTMAIGLSFFLVSNYWNIEYRTGEFEKLADYWISDQCHNLSD
jgi:hypothetical protein